MKRERERERGGNDVIDQRRVAISDGDDACSAYRLLLLVLVLVLLN